ncbi:hypothetical protein ACIA8G_36620 [Lentzea sp. NPDC051213]|uniref:hypothetical protein n=1 Tax=Lentzea sp. NPDC051213 TaxID=3364126 RepID=UPI0037AAD1C3
MLEGVKLTYVGEPVSGGDEKKTTASAATKYLRVQYLDAETGERVDSARRPPQEVTEAAGG